MENSEVVKVESVKAITDTKVKVTFTGAVDSLSADNVSVKGLAVTGVELAADKKSAVVTTALGTAGKSYEMTISGVKVEGKEIPATTITYEMPKAESLYDVKLTIKDEKTVVKADGKDQALVTFELRDNQGQIITDAGKVEVAFTATFGNFGEKRVTVQNGIAQALFTSESLQDAKTALITATVVEAENKNLVNLKAERNILLDPNPNTGNVEEKVGATLTDVAASQADRVIVYFNKEVDVHNYTVGNTFKVDPNKLGLNVWTEVPNNEAHTAAAPTNAKKVAVKGILPVEGNKKALTVMLDTEAHNPDTTIGVLTDNSNFKVQTVDKTGTLDVEGFKSTTLTDARVPAMLDVQRTDLKEIKVLLSEAINSESANDPENWVLDGLRLDNKAWGEAATAKVGAFDSVTGTDNRHIVTITLGKDAKGDQVFFKPGDHSVQGSNIGDWADLSDKGNNVLNTQTLDFNVPADDTIPTAAVTVQSPEQYIVNFNKELTNPKVVANSLKLQKRIIKSDDTIVWEEVKQTDITKNLAKITDISGTEFKVETQEDWTEIYKTKTTNRNYYNDVYRLHLPKGTVKAAANGKGNEEINLVLGGAMVTPDVQSPEIKAYDHVNEIVTMSEPVKLPSGGDALETLAEGQKSIPQPTADFIGKDEKGNYVTIPAQEIKSTFVDNYDMKFKVAPSKKLTPGEWTLVVRSISDDVGNTAASTEFKFTVDKVEKPEFAKDFRVVWAYADTNYDEKNAGKLPDKEDKQDKDTKDAVYVKFNKPVKITGKADNALATANYTLNGQALPKGTQIVGNIVGYDDKDQIIDSVTIVLPNGTITNAETTVLTISEHLTTDKGEELTNGGQFKLSHNIFQDGVSDVTLEGTTNAEENLKALEAALADDSLRKITLPKPFSLPDDTVIEVNRLVNLDLGNNEYTNVDFYLNTTEGGMMSVENGEINKLTINTPNADVESDLTINEVVIEDILDSTFVNKGKITKLTVLDPDGSSIKNDGEGTIEEVIVDTAQPVTLDGDFTKVTVNKAAEITIAEGSKVDKLVAVVEGIVVDNNGTITEITGEKADKVTDVDGEKVETNPGETDPEEPVAPAVTQVVTFTGVEGATVVVKDSTDAEVTAETDGTYKLEAGKYTYTVTKEGFETVEGSITVSDAAITEEVTLVEETVDPQPVTPLSITATSTVEASVFSEGFTVAGTTATVAAGKAGELVITFANKDVDGTVTAVTETELGDSFTITVGEDVYTVEKADGNWTLTLTP